MVPGHIRAREDFLYSPRIRGDGPIGDVLKRVKS